MAISQQKGRKFSTYSSHGSRCLSSPYQVLEFWKASAELLTSGLCWNPEEVGSNTDEGLVKQQDKLASESGDSRHSAKFSYSRSFSHDCHQMVCLPVLNNLVSRQEGALELQTDG